MRKTSGIASSCGAVLWLAAASSQAASDYLLQLDGVKGESAGGATIEVASWSFGASNPTAVGSSGLSAGKVAMQDMNVSAVKSPRDSASGQATGKRQHLPAQSVSGTDAASAPGAAAREPKMGDMGSFTLDVVDSAELAKSALLAACASGNHIPQATLSGRGRTLQLNDVVVSSCAASGGKRKVELKGHVTLIR